jgi:hypothetical protein
MLMIQRILLVLCLQKKHFALLYYDLAGCTVSVFDGLDYDVKTWSQHNLTHCGQMV